MKFMSTQADPDVWIWNAGTHYNMVLVYFDDILVFCEGAQGNNGQTWKLYELKPESIHKPDVYLRENMEKVQLPSGRVEWAMSSKS